MEIVRDIAALSAATARLRSAGPLALVPTMGALHAGHISLLDTARLSARHLVASIFVNPAQFGPNEDFNRYPRQEAADAALLEAAGCDLLFLPPVAAIYPPGFATSITVKSLGDSLCGAARPGHFDGVCVVVAKLLNMARPDIAVFGEKDWQQLAIIRRLVADLDIPVRIIGSPTVREPDGLAMSSRNAYLTPEQRRAAVALPGAMQAAIAAIAAGCDPATALAAAEQALLSAGFAAIDYLTLADADTLTPISAPGNVPGSAPASAPANARLFAAARIGSTRLIDNMPLKARA